MSDTVAINGIVPTKDERTMATLAHVLQAVGGWTAPLVIFFMKRDSRFVSFHALQVLLFHGIYLLLVMIAMSAFFAVAIAGFMFHQPAVPPHASAPPAFFIFFLAVWLGMMGWWVLMVVLAIVYGIKAGKGEWAEYPMLGGLARRILGIGPNGELLA